MPRLNTFRVVQVADSLPERDNLEQGVLYISMKYGCTTHLCFCGCGIEAFIPVEGPKSWMLQLSKDEKQNEVATLRPSLQHLFTCRSHYILTENKVEWC